MEDMIKLVKLFSQDPMQKLAPCHRFRRKSLRLIRCIPRERSSECVVEQAVDVSVPHTREPSVAVAKVLPQERLPQRTVERIVGRARSSDFAGNRVASEGELHST